MAIFNEEMSVVRILLLLEEAQVREYGNEIKKTDCLMICFTGAAVAESE